MALEWSSIIFDLDHTECRKSIASSPQLPPLAQRVFVYSNSWNEWIFKKKKTDHSVTGDFYSVLFSLAISFLLLITPYTWKSQSALTKGNVAVAFPSWPVPEGMHFGYNTLSTEVIDIPYTKTRWAEGSHSGEEAIDLWLSVWSRSNIYRWRIILNLSLITLPGEIAQIK